MSLTTVLLLLLVGLIAGILSGLVGIGGGVVIVPALVLLVGFAQHKAQGTTLAMLMFPVGILGVINYYKKGFVDFKTAALIGAGFVLGAFLGSKLVVNIPELWLKRLFGVFLLFTAIRLIFFSKPSAA